MPNRARVTLRHALTVAREIEMDAATRKMVREWVVLYRGNTEAVAKYMRDTLRIGGLKACRQLVAEALA